MPTQNAVRISGCLSPRLPRQNVVVMHGRLRPRCRQNVLNTSHIADVRTSDSLSKIQLGVRRLRDPILEAMADYRATTPTSILSID